MKKLNYGTETIVRLTDDLKRIGTVEEKIKQRIERIQTNPSDPVEREALLEAIAYQLQSFYTGVEAFLERTLKATNTKIPSGPSHHAEIINAANTANLIPEGQLDYIRDLTKFRHATRHGYGYNIQEELMLPKAIQLPAFWEAFHKIGKRQIKTLKANLDKNESPPGTLGG